MAQQPYVGTGVGTVGALFSGWLLEAYAFPLNFAYIFLIGAAAITLSVGFIALTREPVRSITAAPQIQDRLWSKIGPDYSPGSKFSPLFAGSAPVVPGHDGHGLCHRGCPAAAASPG